MSDTDKLLPFYEMVLRSDESADETSKSVFFDRNQSAIIKCSIGDSGFEPGTLHFSKGHENITKEKTTANSHSYIIRNYKLDFPPIPFECRAQRKSGQDHIRKMHIFPKTDKTIPEGAELCPKDVEMNCNNDGFCVKPKNDDKPYCVCTGIFEGPNCEHINVRNNLVHIPPTRGDMTQDILYSSIAFLAVIALIFAILFSREKVKRMRTKRMLNERIMRTNIHHDETSSLQHYDICDGLDLENGYEALNKGSKSTGLIISEYDNLTPEQNRRLGRDRLNAVSTTPDPETPPLPTTNGAVRNGGILKKPNVDYNQKPGGILNYSPIIKPPLARPAPLASDL
uniref:EGF-like domain-containing protein n=1 Tax=Acrobeloides nanus TaxID=290746 RepID=A0A914EDV7_9BILA